MAALLALVPSDPADNGAISIERAIARRARSGDPRAFRMIFERHATSVRRFLGDLLRDDAAADEATQETFVRAHRKLDTMREDAKLLPWLFGIARNVFYERLRERKRQSVHEPIESMPNLGQAPSPESLLLGREADEVLADALDNLGADRRSALVLRIDHDLGYPEIAEVLGWNVAKVKNEIHRARLQLRAALAGYMENS